MKPVAWIDPFNLERLPLYDCWVSGEKTKKVDIPLYTHPVNPKYDPETGEPLIDGYPLFSGLPHPVKDKPHPKCDEACMYLCQMRELTDEEIKDFIATFPIIFTPDDLVIFARAILRKAQE